MVDTSNSNNLKALNEGLDAVLAAYEKQLKAAQAEFAPPDPSWIEIPLDESQPEGDRINAAFLITMTKNISLIPARKEATRG